jgi:hypothetical protein
VAEPSALVAVRKRLLPEPAVIADLETEAELAETALFEGFGMPREATAVAARIAQAKAELQTMLAGLQVRAMVAPGHARVPQVGDVQAVLDWFTV